MKLFMNSATRINIVLLAWIGAFIAAGVTLWRSLQPYTVPPPRPDFSKEVKAPRKPVLPPIKTAPEPLPKASPPAQPTPSPTPTETPIANGKVTTDIGLVLRDNPSADSGGGSGVSYNAQVSILEESPDREWIRIRNDDTGESGWVRSGNIAR